ncbi:MAG: hypothetical protein AMJ53_11890 [Gammaproteobacteria bacterium SG8_11]|nr:MAG: hypothetical protein AMJ53_11890 [Gammaproteobacteria bacterium SG8_11]
MDKKHKVKILISAVVSLSIIAVSTSILLAGTEKSPRPTAPVAALPVQTVQIRPQNSYEMKRVFSGRVQARRISDLGFDSGGLLVSVVADEGVPVEKGELIARLDTERLEARRTELNAAVTEAKANLSLADATLKRIQAVVKAGGVSNQELDIAREGQRAAQASLTLAKRRIKSLDVELQKTNLYAPYSGTVVARYADEGRVINPGEPILRLQDKATPEIRIGVAGPSVDKLATGNIYELQWHEHTIHARLRAILPLREATTLTVDALFDPVGQVTNLRSGDLVTLPLTSPVADRGAWLPLTALAEGERGLWSVYIPQAATAIPPDLKATHRLVRRTVDVIYQDSDRVYVHGAFDSQDSVVSTGLQRIVPGQWVRISPRMIAQGEYTHD